MCIRDSLKLLARLPIYPMFGRGLTRLQPAYVGDVANAVAKALQRTETRATTFECGGPHIYSYKELLRAVAHEASLKPINGVPVFLMHGWPYDPRAYDEVVQLLASAGRIPDCSLKGYSVVVH